MIRSLIVAVAENGVIGRQGRLPWRLSADLRRFKSLTMGHAVIMGRRTYESIGRPLPGRRMVVVSRQVDYQAPAVEVVGDLKAAYRHAAEQGDAEAFVIGGAEIFREALPEADRLYLTRVHATVEGDVHLPPLDLTFWRQCSAEDHQADDQNQHPFTFEFYERQRP